ncbi:NusA-like transcription termination signal-binding factor [Candidatus Woesearchaeota archaeon]|nr:NusA-like transcription termination signal-binding factor [Candidatus Woesearchaeota archaeon]
MTRTLNEDDLKLMGLFEKRTGAVLKDCIKTGEIIAFIVLQGLEKAIGPGGKNIKSLEKAMNKRIRVIQWDEDKDQFIKNTFSPYQISNIIEKDGKITLEASDYKTRGMLIGRNASTLRTNETIIRRYFPIGELRVA